MNSGKPYNIRSVSEYHELLGIDPPRHPLFSIISHEDIRDLSDERLGHKTYDFYTISRKIGYAGTMKYGQHYYDFREGTMVFHGPGQVIVSDLADDPRLHGWTVLVHPDFIRPYPLAAKLGGFGFFSYAVHEALHLAEEEAAIIEAVMDTARKEYSMRIDTYSQDILAAQLELLLNYCNRFYNRQFLTRKAVNSGLLTRFEQLLNEYVEEGSLATKGIPPVHYFSNALNLSANYLSDLLRSLTGQSTQQHVHARLAEEAKQILATTNLTVSEIAYELGFRYPQSFSKFFKSKTRLTPLEFRQSFN